MELCRFGLPKEVSELFHSAFALRRISDLICIENGLSVIEKPKPSPGKDYAKYMFGENRPPSFHERLRRAIDEELSQSPNTFEEFIDIIRSMGITAERRGKHMRFKLPDQQRPTRLETLSGDYTEDAIRERIALRRIVTSPAGKAPVTINIVVSETPSLLIDIERKMREGKGVGYERWAKGQNLKSMAKTLIYLQERGLDNQHTISP
ncbi:hypothetical protein AGMMS49975_08370 [Clostridia bacterium]|nr:hypothetical protein AGMMS49975_08370 [Clostridia bacterium]